MPGNEIVYSDDSGDSDDAEAVRLGPSECDRLCKQFAEITSTDMALAMMLLQRNRWSLENALAAYFNKIDGAGGNSNKKKGGESKLREPRRIKILSWNTDGLDQSEVESRAKCLSTCILRENPDVVMLQEVIATTAEIYNNKLEEKYDLSYSDYSEDYFTGIGVRKHAGTVESHSFQPFHSSIMGRGLQIIEAVLHGFPTTIVTTHLESLKKHDSERCRQLKALFTLASDTDLSRLVLVGGDLNLREPELARVGGIPSKFSDAWLSAGSRPEARMTWDMRKNDNHNDFGGRNPNARFDRIYFRSADNTTVKPVYFELVGLERMTPLRRFPSDHWGILFHADILSS